MATERIYALQEIETLRRAFRLVCVSTSGYPIEDFQVLASAADILDIQITDLPHRLTGLFQSPRNDAGRGKSYTNRPGQSSAPFGEDNVTRETNMHPLETDTLQPRQVMTENVPNTPVEPRREEKRTTDAGTELGLNGHGQFDTQLRFDRQHVSNEFGCGSYGFNFDQSLLMLHGHDQVESQVLPSCVALENDTSATLHHPGWTIFPERTPFESGPLASTYLPAVTVEYPMPSTAPATTVMKEMTTSDVSSDDSETPAHIMYTPLSGSDDSGIRELDTSPSLPRLAPRPIPARPSPSNFTEQVVASISNKVSKSYVKGRARNVCIRCRMQKIGCTPNPSNPHGPCLPCTVLINSIYRIPCLRYMIPDCFMFRSDVANKRFYSNHPFVGDRYGDFHLPKTWTAEATRKLHITQDRGLILEIDVRRFEPPPTDDLDPAALEATDGRPIYAIPWAIPNPDSELHKLQFKVFGAVEQYLDVVLDDSDRVIWDVYHSAYRLSVFPVPNPMLTEVLRLWTAQRLLESKWRCCGNDDNLNAASLPNVMYAADVIAIPSYIDYQYFSIVMHRLLSPLKKSVLHRLQAMVKENKPGNWYTIFLTCFILLHSYELQMNFIFHHARRRNAPVRYIYMHLVRAIQSGSKTILAHFHYCLKGQAPFDREFDWMSPVYQNMAQLDKEQLQFMQEYVKLVHMHEPDFKAVRSTDCYDQPYYFVSQLFEKDWVPRDTNEHSPAFWDRSSLT